MRYLARLDDICPSFEDLPEAVKNNHIDASSRLLLNRAVDKYRERVDVEEVVARLSRSGEPVGVRRINELAFADHVSNFRAESLNDFFGQADVPGLCQAIKLHHGFRQFMLAHTGKESLERLDNRVAFEDLNDLAQRRNEVSHGMASVMLSTEMMRERVAFLRSLGEVMCEVVLRCTLSHELEHLTAPLPKPIAVHNNHIVCMRLEQTKLQVGMRVAARSTSGRIQVGEIESIQVNHVDHAEIEAPPAVDVGFRVPFETKATHEFFLFK